MLRLGKSPRYFCLKKIIFNLLKASPIYLEDFLSVALSDAGPPSFIWLNILHRFIVVQSVQHSVKCSACERSNFNGFRYKCQKCRKYQLCQDCFWRGRISHSHQLTHQMKEYTSYVRIIFCFCPKPISLFYYRNQRLNSSQLHLSDHFFVSQIKILITKNRTKMHLKLTKMFNLVQYLPNITRLVQAM